MSIPTRTPRFTTVLALTAVLLLGGCGGDESSNGATTSKPPKAVTQAAVVEHLQGVLKAIEAKAWDDAAAHFHFGERAPKPEDWPGVFAGMVSKREISAEGIAILAEKGTFGLLQDVFAERGASWAERAGVAIDRCYALSHDGAEVAVYAGDEGLKLIRLDDVGKLN